MINLSSADLNYLLQQVNIGADYSQLTSPLDPLGVREVSGQNNNLVGGFVYNPDGTVTWTGNNLNGDWGQADTDFPRLFYTDTPGAPSYGITYGSETRIAIADAAGNQPIVNGALNPTWTPTFTAVTATELGTSPRTITQLISSSDVDPNSPTFNPAAAAAMAALGGQPVDTANSVVGTATTAKLPDPGILGGVPFNEYFVAFGQFFDHGLDFISKNGGYVLIRLSPTDPLYDENANPANPFANTMMLSRAKLTNPNDDFEVVNGNIVLKAGVAPTFNNNTGLLIDQSQTYGSHVSVNVLVRQYDANGLATGKLITSAEDMSLGDVGYEQATHDLGTWADMIVNAARLGIGLVDLDVIDAPAIKATATGAYTFTAQQDFLFTSAMSIADIDAALSGGIMIDGTLRYSYADVAAYDPFLRDANGNVLKSNQAILADMGNGASPMSPFGTPLPTAAEAAAAHGGSLNGLTAGIDYYDPALLASHYVSGDGRVNENIGLTAVHHVFHEEHNIEVEAIKTAVSAQAALLNDGSAAGIQAEADYLANWQTSPGVWDAEKVYQAARIITESEYNHIAIDQYVGGLVVLPEFVSYSSDVNMSVTLEFSQAVFRLGHSMLNEKMQVAIADAEGNAPSTASWTPTYTEVDLFDAFLNPALYGANGASNITLGLLNQQANQVDEFVTSALQQSLVGIGLDLPALNIARGRDVGLPTLNELRQQIFEGLQQNTNGTGAGIAPYVSWEDWGGHLRYPESLANFIAAYGRDNATFHLQELRVAYEAGTDVSDTAHALNAYDLDHDGVIGIQDMRQNAQAIVDAAADANDPMHEEALMFMRGTGSPVYNETTGTWDINSTGNGGDQGFWDIDLWVGGLAEQPLFDGPLGTTFTMVMADFGQKMQDGDRFYYLYRMPVGQHLGDQIIGEQFADLIMRTTGLEHIGDAFGYQSATFILDGTNHDNPYDGVIGVDDQYGINDYFNAIYESLPGSVQAFFLQNSTLASGALYSQSTAQSELLVAGSALTVTVDLADQDLAQGGMLGFVDVAVKDALTGEILAHQDNVLVDNGMHTLILDVPQVAYANNGHGITVEVDNHISNGSVDVKNVTVTQSSGGGSANDGHIVVAGLEGNDYIVGALGDDYIYGDAGNDVLEGAQGNDHIYGGDGDDWITDYENDDFIHGGAGNDYINAGPGVLDTSHGGDGDDEVHGGDGVDEVFGDDGDDRLYGDGDTDLIMGGDGSDYMDGGDSVDEMFGGNGNDWMRGGVGDDNINGGSGNDLLEGGLGPTANDGDRLNGDTAPGALPVIEFNGDGTEGDMDIVSYENVSFKIVASLQDANANGTSSNLLDTYALDEGLVGSAQDDELTGADANGTAGNGVNNYLIGGGGNDKLTGLGDDAGAGGPGTMDFIFGDSVVVDNDLYWIGDDRHLATGHGGIDTDGYLADGVTANTERKLEGANFNGDGLIKNWYGTGETRVVFEDGTLGHILGDHGTEGTSDTAVYSGNRADYLVEGIEMNGQQAVRITDLRDPTAVDENGNLINPSTDGVDILVGVEWAQFADQTTSIALTPPVLDLHAVNLSTIADNFNTASWSNSTGTASWASNWSENGDSLSGNTVTGGQVQLDAGFGGGSNQLRLLDNGDGASIQRSFSLAGAATATLSFDYSESSFDAGESVVGSVSFDNGASWHILPGLTLDSGTNGGGTYSVSLSTLLGPGETFGSNAVIKFEALTSPSGNGYIAIDNLTIDTGTPVADGGALNYSTSFTEGDAPVAIASGPLITDDSPTMERAVIILTNAKPGDVLTENGINGDGISGNIDTSVQGQVTLTLTGQAPIAAYQAAISAVTFRNTSISPDETPRIIEVKVFDGLAYSNIATTTIDVTNVPTPPQASNDSVYSNASSFSVPTWALLANDFSEGGLSVTNVTENSSSFTAVLNGLNVDVTKTTNSIRSFTYTATDLGGSDTANASVSIDSTGTFSGGGGNDIMIGDGGNSTIDAGTGDDIVLAGAGDDTVVWNVSNPFFIFPEQTDGHDFVDGGTNGPAGDRFVVNGNNTSETFRIFTRAAWAAVIGNSLSQLNANTEIVITRNGTDINSVIAELDNIEEITVNTNGITVPGNDPNGGTTTTTIGADTVEIIGDFNATSLNFNTITVNGSQGDETVDISSLSSEHRVVFNGNGGNDHFVGQIRPQDVIADAITKDYLSPQGSQSGGEDNDDDSNDLADNDDATNNAGSTGGNGSGDPNAAVTTTQEAGTSTTPSLQADGNVVTGDGMTLEGTANGDIIIGTDAAKVILAGAGSDIVSTTDTAAIVLGGDGDDIIETGAGNDKVFGEAGSDVINSGDGDDMVWGGQGEDEIHAGAGDDRVEGGEGADLLFGGSGNDLFVFRTAADANGDTIGDFQAGDRVDLHFIDADATADGNSAFQLAAGSAFTGAGELIVQYDANDDTTVISGNTDTNLDTAEFEITLTGNHETELRQGGLGL
ncbi:MAG: peroxidase family protein [Hyphomicrobium sp.]